MTDAKQAVIEAARKARVVLELLGSTGSVPDNLRPLALRMSRVVEAALRAYDAQQPSCVCDRCLLPRGGQCGACVHRKLEEERDQLRAEFTIIKRMLSAAGSDLGADSATSIISRLLVASIDRQQLDANLAAERARVERVRGVLALCVRDQCDIYELRRALDGET